MHQSISLLVAIAELTWTAPELRKDTDAFLSRLTAMHLNHSRISPSAGLKWTPEFLSSEKDWIVPTSTDLTASNSISVSFEYRSGTHGLDITAVELLADGQQIAEDRHTGFTSGSPKKTIYQKSLSLRISAKGAGGNDSRGEIILSGKP